MQTLPGLCREKNRIPEGLLVRTDVCLVQKAEFLQVGADLLALLLACLRQSHMETLKPLLCRLLILGLENVAFTVGEDLKCSWQGAVSALLGHHFDTLNLAQFYQGILWIIFLQCRRERERKREL